MAIRIPNKNPLDLDNNVAVGVAIPFNQFAVFRSTFTTTDQIKSNLINYILTKKGERVFNANFGSNVTALLFNNITPQSINTLESSLIGEIQTNFPQIQIKSLTLTPSYDTNTVSLVFSYSIYNGTPETVEITL